MGKETKKSSAQLDIGTPDWKAATDRELEEAKHLAEVKAKLDEEAKAAAYAEEAAASKKGMDDAVEVIVETKPDTKKGGRIM